MKIDTQEMGKLLWARRRTMAAAAGMGLALGLLYSLVGAKWYEARMAVVPVSPSRQGGIAGALAAGLGGMLPSEIAPASADVERIAAVLESQSVVDGVIERLGLMSRYKVRYIEQARKVLAKRCDTEVVKKPQIVKLTCEDKDPVFAQQLVLTFAELGNATFVRVGAGSATAERRFLEKRVAEARKEADDAATRLQVFQEQHGIIDLGEQSKVVVSSLASLRKDELAKELELSYLSTFASRDESTAVQLRQQLALLKQKRERLESAGSAAEGDAKLFPSALAIPKLAHELVPLIREQKIREATHAMLVDRLEAAKVNEARDTPNFTILDAPRVPTYRSHPTRTGLLAMGLILGLLGGAAFVLYRPVRETVVKPLLASLG